VSRVDEDGVRYGHPATRAEHASEIDRLISEWTITHTKQEAMEALGRAGVPAGAILDTQELSDDEDLQRRETIVTVEHPQRGRFKMPDWPVKMERSRVEVTAAPLIGQHNSEVYSELLNLEPDDLKQLEEEGVI